MTGESERELSRRELSDAVSAAGWRYVLAVFITTVRVESLARATALAAQICDAIGPEADEHLRFDLRPDRLGVAVQTQRSARLTRRDIDIARRISDLVALEGLMTNPHVDAEERSVQLVEIAIDALDIPKIRPFWKAVMGYGDEADRTGPEDALIDPQWQSPAIWFQQMDAPRPQRNRIHFDISVPHDEAERRVAAALAAGGTLLSDRSAPAFWVLGDAEGNEACVTTWQGRD